MTTATVNIGYTAKSIEDLHEAVKAVQNVGLDATVAVSPANARRDASAKG
jgi:hypothetical protein